MTKNPAAIALAALRRGGLATCERCQKPLDGLFARRYCSHSCRQLAYIARKTKKAAT